MTPPPLPESDAERVKDVLAGALELAPDQRGSFVARECEGHPARAARVHDLLAALEGGEGFMADVTLPPDQLPSGHLFPASPLAEGPGDTIGRYKLLEQIGEGGFGVVFMARQTEPVRREVALKIIKLGLDTQQVVRRFEAERQALAMMDHPNIARVFDGGATATGRPYFVMELVRGVPITDYCTKHGLGLEARLSLFADVCTAVQHAHLKGVIHRDIKPTNVLVTVVDFKPVPKVIDFGIAKATSGRLTEQTLFTEFRQLVGTPEYMSPEQADTASADIDTRTDVCSLGVLLYELLTGATPFEGKRLRSAAPLDPVQHAAQRQRRGGHGGDADRDAPGEVRGEGR
ncbi:MAG: hypothetical protein ACI89L_001665 [Phycisphaerales bacterium]|jgi:hypothetical protein